MKGFRGEQIGYWNKLSPGVIQHSHSVPGNDATVWLSTQQRKSDLYFKNGEFLAQASDKLNWFDQVTAEQLCVQLREILAEPYRWVDASLQDHHERHFNGHALDNHIESVVRRGLNVFELLRPNFQTNFPEFDFETERKIFVLAAYAHDLGNLYSREGHPFISWRVMTKIIPALANLPPGILRRVRNAVRLHDEKLASQALQAYLRPGAEQEMGQTEHVSDGLWSSFGVAGLVLVLSDKADAVDRRRAPLNYDDIAQLLPDQSPLYADVHARLAAAARVDSKYQLKAESRLGKGPVQIATRTVVFTPGLSREEIERLGVDKHGATNNGVYRSKPGGVAVKFDQTYADRHDTYGMPHMLTWFEEYSKHHLDRLKLEATAFFLLFPQVDYFQLVIQDNDERAKTRFTRSGDQAGMRIVLTVSRTQLDSDLNIIRESFEGSDEGGTYVPNEFVAEVIEKARNHSYLLSKNGPSLHNQPILLHESDNQNRPPTVSVQLAPFDDHRDTLQHLQTLFKPDF